MFNNVESQFTQHGIDWEYCSTIGLDNTNVNVGEYNSIKSRARDKFVNQIVIGCPCHILHNTSEKGGESFTNVCGFDVADDCTGSDCTDLYYWFYKSSKRKSVLKEYNEFCNEVYAKVIRNVSTRWLCLEKCISREIDKYDGLKSYFLSEDFPNAWFQRLNQNFGDPMTKIYLSFYQATTFTTFNKMLQSGDPLIHYTPSNRNSCQGCLANLLNQKLL